MNNEYRPWIQTYTGGKFDLVEPLADSIDIEDIAHALGMLCRYCGHVKRFYSVAEHCIVMSRIVDDQIALYALLHDATEAYVADLSRPIKTLLPEYSILETKVAVVIYEHLGMEYPSGEIQKEIKKADLRMLLTERDQLMLPPPEPWTCDGIAEPYQYSLRCWLPHDAMWMYLDTFNALMEGR